MKITDVKKIGVAGDGVTDETPLLQSAIDAAGEEETLLFPAGVYLTGPLFLKSGLTLRLEKGAVLKGLPGPASHPIIPGEEDGRIQGTWEGEIRDMYASLLTGFDCRDIVVTGEGTIDGNSSFDTWWREPKKIIPAARPRIIFLNRCRNILIEGITVTNSPSWNIHPFCCENLTFRNLKILSPPDSPNTDGINPEFCRNVKIENVRFFVGDDCIAVKAGKKELADRLKLGTENIVIEKCLMERGHGGVVIGSEMSGGVKSVTVRECVMRKTDRGVRVKTRRGRGGAVEDLYVDRVKMEDVETPFVVNCYYFCDRDGHEKIVWDKSPHPVDDGTPRLRRIRLENMEISGSRTAAFFIYGLPEAVVETVTLKNIEAVAAPNETDAAPAMMDGLRPFSGEGTFFMNVKDLTMENVSIIDGGET